MATTTLTSTPRPKVCYYYAPQVGDVRFGDGHPMKPLRLKLTHNLVCNYGLHDKMKIYSPNRAVASTANTSKFHELDYLSFLENPSVTGEVKYGVGTDVCPAFAGMYEFCQLSTAASISAAARLNAKDFDIAINWAGGSNHAQPAKAAGHGYINDVVLAIRELLKCHERVLYVNVGVHHADAVETAFYATDRVTTVSFHRYGDLFFPGTGDVKEVGTGKGKFYSVNVPLQSGLDDTSFISIFGPIMTRVMEVCRPNAIVLQSGADTLPRDRLGCFNLTLTGHAHPLKLLKRQNLPLLLLGGGGSVIRNVARCWTYETAVALGMELHNDLPFNDYLGYYLPDFKLNIAAATDIPNLNTPAYLEKVKQAVLENLRQLP